MHRFRRIGFLVVAAALMMAPQTANADDRSPEPPPNGLESYIPLDASGQKFPAPAAGNILEVKFRPSARFDVENGRVQAKSANARTLLQDSDVANVAPLFQLAQPELRVLKADAEVSSAKEQPELGQWVQISVAPGADAAALAKRLNADDSVEAAYVRPAPVKPPAPAGAMPAAVAANANYVSSQGYLGDPEKTYGINALYAHTIKGGDGTGVTIADVENGWDFNHSDLTKMKNASVTRGTPVQQYEYHGTAVMGQLVADKNSFGVTGIAYGADAMVSHVTTRELGYNPANAIAVAANRLEAGDVLVIEQQTAGCGGNYAPMEWWPSVYESIRTAVGKGIHVVEAAGNGSENLDASCYGASFPGGRADSGAIIVGAGAGRTAQGAVCGSYGYRQGFSTYGSRVNSFAWGRCVTTTYPNNSYTTSFSGTSSATPIVAGAVASLSGIAKQRGIALTPAKMRELVASTGTKAAAQQGIGTMPDLKKAIAELDKIDPGEPKPDPDPEDPKPEPKPDCSAFSKKANGSIDQRGYAVFPNGKHYYATAGQHRFCVAGGDYRMDLQLWNGSTWLPAAESDAEKRIDYRGGDGYYRLVVRANNGAQGKFVLGYSVDGNSSYR